MGSGFGGLAMAYRLLKEGRRDFVVLERADEVGGTWRDNTYPGCQCDVPSHLYSFSFAPNPNWSRTYSKQPEIQAYLRRVADQKGIRDYIRFGCDVTGMAWDDEAQRWRIESSRGPLAARILVLATGPLTEPSLPDIPGLDSFEGAIFHSARWDHDHDLHGERVAVIGTGASAIQFVPAIQPEVERLDVYQRTAPWVLPHVDRPVTGLQKAAYRTVPGLQKLIRRGIYWSMELLVFGTVYNPKLLAPLERIGRRHLALQVRDKALRAKLKPDYTVGCKRILRSNTWYPALTKENVEVVTDTISEVRPHSIVGADGTEREVDTIILGTGFHVTDVVGATHVHGRGGQSLVESWNGSPQAHLGITVAGFPNLFLLLGPNTGLGHTSVVYMIESQSRYIIDALRVMDQEEAAVVEVTPEAQARFVAELAKRSVGTVWFTGCKSWYLDKTGRNSTIWPSFTFRYRKRTAAFDAVNYTLRPERSAAPDSRRPVVAPRKVGVVGS